MEFNYISSLNNTYFLNNETFIFNCTENEQLLEVSWYTTSIFIILFGTLSVLAVLGNSLIVWVVIRNKRMHNVTNYFISNLAMADIVIGLFAIPFQVIIFALIK